MQIMFRWPVIFFLFSFFLYLSAALKPSFIKTISSGRVHSIENWIPDDHVQRLRELFTQLQGEGLFQASGLSYSEPYTQDNNAERLVCDEIPEHYLDNPDLSDLTDLIDALRVEVPVDP